MPHLAANLTMLYQEMDFLDRFRAATNDGFKGVEYLFPYPYPKEALVEKLQENNLLQVLHNLPAGDWNNGERGIACLPGREAEFQGGVGFAIEYATALGCKQVNCLAGIHPEAESDQVKKTFVENISFAAKKLKEAGITLVIEAINTRDIPGFYLNNTRQALDLIAEVGSDNVFVQYDIYHMQIMEGDLAPTMERHLSQIKHIQLADNPGRHEPGTGEINYPFLLKFLDDIGYDGWIGCEYIPLTTATEGLGWAKDYLSGE